jgi:hypothetical protein
MVQSDSAVDKKSQMAQKIDEEVEGRLSAHRYILSHLLKKLSTDPGDRKALLDWLGERASVNDGEEDPGAVIVQGFAEQQARADEFKIISEDVRRLIELDNRR